MDPKKFNIDDILKDSGKSFQKNPFEDAKRATPVAEPASRPWHQLAPHKNRIAAFLLDFIPIFLLVTCCYYLFTDFGPILDDYLVDSSDIYTRLAFWEQLSFIQWTSIATWILYGTIMESSERRATYGKEYMQLQVVGKEGEQLSLGKAAARNFSKIISQLIYGLGFLWSFWDADRQTWHDKIAKTYVIAEEEKKGGFFL
jgi:uncharacterized RDD family membrane protein YckC